MGGEMENGICQSLVTSAHMERGTSNACKNICWLYGGTRNSYNYRYCRNYICSYALKGGNDDT